MGRSLNWGRELLFPISTGSNDQRHPGLWNSKCDTGKNHTCYKQYDEEWCSPHFLNNEAMYVLRSADEIDRALLKLIAKRWPEVAEHRVEE